MTDNKTPTLAQQNDTFRRAGIASGGFTLTCGVAARGEDFIARAVAAVCAFDAFTPDNDPYGEHDFGSFTLDGCKLFWKIDCYDLAMRYGSPDASDPRQTRRVLTVMLASEY